MPCRNDYDPSMNSNIFKDCNHSAFNAELEVVAPALCAVFRKLEAEHGLLMEGFLNQIDWRGAGVTKKEVLSWWNTHKEQDERRREREAQEAAAKKLKKAALAKLTPEERKLLGVR